MSASKIRVTLHLNSENPTILIIDNTYTSPTQLGFFKLKSETEYSKLDETEMETFINLLEKNFNIEPIYVEGASIAIVEDFIEKYKNSQKITSEEIDCFAKSIIKK